MSEYYDEKHNVAVSMYGLSADKRSATVKTYGYPDGSSRANGLDATDLREIAAMLNDAADKLE